MEETKVIVNKVAESDIRVFNLEALWDDREIVELDVAEWLFKRLVLKEKDFRQHVREQDWSQYDDKHVAIFCSTDAILPTWAMMLVATRLAPYATSIVFGKTDDVIEQYFDRALATVDWSEYRGAPVVIKGCASKIVPQSAYVAATVRLQGEAAKLMFGEPCSAVPLWRKKQSVSSGKGNVTKGTGGKPATLPPGFLKGS